MPLENFRDLSATGNDVTAGFQFEFSCHNCGRSWKSPFKPYRLGQITGVLTRFTFLFTDIAKAGRASGNIADMGARGARAKALAGAREEADKRFVTCPGCLQGVCNSCFDGARDRCNACLEEAGQKAEYADRRARQEERERAAATCPHCSAAHAGGRFCAECGFDMASTHKSCPACATLLPRQARFCTECGHGF